MWTFFGVTAAEEGTPLSQQAGSSKRPYESVVPHCGKAMEGVVFVSPLIEFHSCSSRDQHAGRGEQAVFRSAIFLSQPRTPHFSRTHPFRHRRCGRAGSPSQVPTPTAFRAPRVSLFFGTEVKAEDGTAALGALGFRRYSWSGGLCSTHPLACFPCMPTL